MIGDRIFSVTLRGAVVLLAFVLLAPIVIVLIVSFSGDAYLTFPPSSFSLRWYIRFLADPRWRAAFENSTFIAVGTSLLSTCCGFLAAYAVIRMRPRAANLVTAVVLVPLIVPHVITAIGLYFLSSKLNLVGNRYWIIVAHSVLALPLALIIQRSALEAMDPSLERAAMVFGCSRFGIFRRLTLPLAFPGVISAALFSFLTSFDEVVVSLFLTGVRMETLPVRIWNSLELEVEPTIAAVSAVLIGLTLVGLMLDQLLRLATRRRGGSAELAALRR